MFSVASGAWENPATWSTGTVPTAAQNPLVSSGTTVTVNASAAVANTVAVAGTLTISGSSLTIGGAATSGIEVTSSGTLNISGGTVNIGPQDNSFANRSLTLNGALNVSSGTLNLAGNMLLNLSGSLTQSGGNINVDGNAGGNAANSVANTTNIVQLNGNNNITLTGGTFTIVDPHAGISTTINAFNYTAGAGIHVNSSPSHNFRFGNGVSTDAGGSTAGFRSNTWPSSGRFLFGNLTIDMAGGTNRYVTQAWSHGVAGNLTINSGSEYRATVVTYVAGNLVNNGTLVASSTLYFGNFLGGVVSATTVAQTIGGSGTFQNTVPPTAPTGNVAAISFNNTHPSGVTLNVPLTVTGALGMIDGVVNTSSTNFITHISTVSNNVTTGGTTVGYINGPHRRQVPASVAGPFTAWMPVGVNGANHIVFYGLATNAGGPVVFEARTNNTLGAPTAFDGSLTAINLNREWVTSIVSGIGNLASSIAIQAYDDNMVLGDALAGIKAPATQFSVLSSGSGFVAPAAPFGPGLFLGVTILSANFPDRIGFGTTGPLNINGLLAEHTNLAPVTPGQTNQQMLRIAVTALGSSGAAELVGLKFTYNGSSAADIANNGVKLWNGTFTAPTTQIGTGINLTAGEANFNSFVAPLVSGNNFFWVTLDVAGSATLGNFIDGQIIAGDAIVNVSGGATVIPVLPATTQNPAGNRLIDYCLPTFTNSCTSNDILTNFSINSLSATPNCPGPLPNNYAFLPQTTSLEQGVTYTVNYTTGGFTQGVTVWIDFNNNGVFEAGEGFAAPGTTAANTSGSFNITIPAISTGIRRLRVINQFNAVPPVTDVCSSFSWGSVFDFNVTITSPTPAVLGTITATHTETSGMGVNTTNNNMMRVAIPVTGSNGTYTLNQIRFTYTGANVNDIAANGVSLWTGTVSAPATQIGTSLSITGGQVNFTGLTQALSSGTNYIWLRVNTSASALIPNPVDFTIAAADITISETAPATPAGSQPATTLNPAGNRFIDYCAPTYSTGCAAGADAILNVTLVGETVTLNNTTGCAPSPFYTYYDAAPQPDLFRGATYNVSVSFGSDGSQWARIWIDFNNNGVFETTESFVSAVNAGANGTAVIPVTIPVTATLGTLRMRIRGADDSAPTAAQACGASSSAWGEAEDYQVNIIPPPVCSLPLPSAGNTTASTVTACSGGTVTFNITGTMPNASGITYQLRRNGSNLGSPVSALPINQVVTLTGNYDIVVLCSGNPGSTSTAVSVTVNAPTVTPGPGVTRCGTGTANLTASLGGGATQIRWWDAPSGGNLLASGSPFTTPSISSTTTYYVDAAAAGAPANGGRLVPTIAGSTTGSGWGLVFDAFEPFTLNSVDVYPATTAGNITIQVQTNTGTPIPGLSGTYAFPAGSGTTPHTINLGFDIPAGTGLRLIATSITGGALRRESAAGGFPYPLSTVGNVTNGYIAGLSTTYYWFYNWSVNTVCASARSPITVTVNTPPALTLSSSSATICDGSSTASVNVTAPSPLSTYNTYTWAPATGVNGTGSGPFTFNPSTSTTYTLTAAQTSGSQCVNTTTFTVNVNPTPSTGTATATANPICQGSNINLQATGFVSAPVAILSQNFESGIGTWTIESATTGGSNPAVGNFNIRPHGWSGGNSGTTVFNSPGGNNFILADADGAGSGVSVSTRLVSPPIDLSGFSNASLNWRHRVQSGGTINVQLSTDGGTSWPIILASYTVTEGTLTGFIDKTLSLNAYTGNPNVRVRFNYVAGWSWHWAIDDITVTTTGVSYAWTGPNSFTSAVQNPVVSSAAPINSGIYTVTATNPIGCSATASTPNITVNGTVLGLVTGSAPHAIGTVNCQIVVGTSKSPLGNIETALAQNGTISWTHNGTGSISAGGTTTSPTYTPGPGDAGNLVTLTMTVTPPAPCSPVNANYVITFRNSPVIAINDPTDVCIVGDPFRVLNVQPPIQSGVDYLWPALDLYTNAGFTSVYNAGNSATQVWSVPFGTHTYQVSSVDINGCVALSNSITVVVCPALTQTICDADAQPLVPVTATPVYTSYNLVGATPSPLGTGVSCNTPITDLVRDVFYRVTVPDNGEVVVVTQPGNNTNPALNIENTFVQILAGANCNATSIQACDRGGAAANHSYAHASGLTPGQTAYVRLAQVAQTWLSGLGVSSAGTTITVPSTAGMLVGMEITVVAGSGTIPPATTVSSILSATQFVVNNAPSGFSGTTELKGKLAQPAQTTVRMAVTNSLHWTGIASNDWANPANWHGGDATALTVPNSQRSVTISHAVVPRPSLTANSDVRGVAFTNGAATTPGIVMNGFTLNTTGNWSVAPASAIVALDQTPGTVRFNGLTAQSFSNGAKVRFDNLTLENFAGLNVVGSGSNIRVHGILNTINGTFNTADRLFLHSTAAKTAVVNPGSGIINGQVSVERRLTSNFAATAHLASAVSGAVMNSTITGYRDDYAFANTAAVQNYGPGVPGFFYSPTPIGFTDASTFPRIWEWVQDHYTIGDNAGLLTVPQGTIGVTSDITGWKSAVQNNVTPGKGFAHTNIPNNITVDVYGPLNNGNVTYNATFTNAPAPWNVTNGWNLIGNPYASALNWEAMRGNPLNNGVATTYYIYKQSGTGAGNYGTYTTGGAQTNSTTANIPSSHAFIVIANGANTTVNFENSFRTFNPLGNGNQFQSSSTANSIRLQVRGGQGDDETLIRFGAGFSNEFSHLEDAQKLMAYAAGVPSVYSIAGTQRSAMNALPELTQDYIIPLGVFAQVAGTYEIEMTELVDMNPTVMVYLEDLATGTLQNLRNNAIYSANISTSGNIDDRFRLIVRPAVSLNGIAANCNASDGKVEVNYPSSAAVNIELKNSLGAVVAAAQNVNGSYTFNNIAAGNYMAEVSHNCGYVSVDYVSVAAGNGVSATLVASTNTVNLESNLAVTFTATAQNATSFNWNFGDGTVINNGPANVSHTYTAAGNYIVTFTANNAECSAVASAEVSVVSPTGIFDENADGVRIFGVRNRVNVQFNNLDDKQGRIEIMNLLGQNIRTVDVNTTKGTREIEVPGVSVGHYLVRVSTNNKVYTQKVYLTK
jgi:hypothetical protein